MALRLSIIKNRRMYLEKHKTILFWMFALSLPLVLGSCGDIKTDVVAVNRAGAAYVGQMANDKREGLGALMQGDSVIYSGQWRSGMRQGKGMSFDSLGIAIEGEWDHDSLVGGTRVYGAGDYAGELNRAGQPHGHGAISSTDSYYEGRWVDGRRSGLGFELKDNKFRIGEWKGDRYRGERLNYTSERIYGIDISKHQHVKKRKKYSIDWNRLRITHLGSLSKKNVSGSVDFPISFIFIKATEGRSITNAYYAADYAAARAYGYPVGSYHFFSHRSTGSQQAHYFLAHSHVRQGDLPPVLDLEPLPSQVKAMGGSAAMWARVRNWLQIVEKATGMRPILYVSQTFVNRYLDDAPDIKQTYPVWIARYGEYKPDVKLLLWQLAPDGRVAGIHGEVDINVFNGYEGEFKQWLNEVRKK